MSQDLQKNRTERGFDWSGPGEGHVADISGHGNESSVSIKCGEFDFLDELFPAFNLLAPEFGI